VVLVVALGLLGPPAAGQDPAADGLGGRLELAAPVGFAVAGQPLTITLRAAGMPPSEGISVQLRDRVRSRSELARAVSGNGLRGVRDSVDLPATALLRQADGTFVVSVPTGEGPDAIALGGPGVYPITIARTGTAAGKAMPLVTQLIVPPGPDDTSPPLNVAVVADLSTSPARTDSGAPEVDPDELAALDDVVAALETVPAFPMTVSVSPELIVALALTDGGAGGLFQRMVGLAQTHLALAAPFVEVAPDALADAGLDTDLTRQLSLGTEVLQRVLGVAPVAGTWLLDEPLGKDGLELLRSNGVHRVVVGAGLLAPANDRVFTIARPFALAAPGVRASDTDEDPIVALAADAAIAARLRSDAAPGAITTQVVAELAALWAEQPTVRRSAVISIDRTTSPEVVAHLEQALSAAEFLRPVHLDDAVDGADPLVDGSDDLRRLAIAPAEAVRLGTAAISSIATVRDQFASLRSLLAPDDPVLAGVEADMLRSEAVGLSAPERAAHLADARLHIGAVVGAVDTEGTETVTLTARKGNLPLTIVNNSGTTLFVELHLRGAKVEVPGGRDIPLDLPPGVTRVNIDVRTRASGSIPLELVVSSPDGRLLLTSALYTVQSTAVSGVGIVLSAGAMLFLLVWWGRHWREHRRSRKLIDADSDDLGDDGNDEAGAEVGPPVGH
jgi:hypothetical protein